MQPIATVNPLHGPAARPAAAPAPLLAQHGSLLLMSPPLHYFVLLVLGPYHAASKAPPPTLTPHFFVWSAVLGASFGMFGFYIGPYGGGWALNVTIATLFLVALLWFVLIRRTLARVLHDLAPVLRCFGQAEHNPLRTIQRDRARMAAVVLAMGLGIPSIVVAAAVYWFRINTYNTAIAGSYRVYVGVLVGFVGFFFASLILAVQLVLLFAVAQLYIFRLRYLFSAMLLNHQELFEKELCALTPPDQRRLLAEAPAARPRQEAALCSVFFRSSTPPMAPETPYTLRPYSRGAAAPAQGAAGPGGSGADAQQQQQPPALGASGETVARARRLDVFLRVYRSIAEEAAVHAQSWSIPILFFVVAYAFFFVIAAVTILRDLVQTGFQQGKPIPLEVLYIFLALAYLVLNLVPIISINSTWRRLLQKPEANLSQWDAQDRLILSAYFTEHPLVFPVLGIKLGWNNVLCVLALRLLRVWPGAVRGGGSPLHSTPTPPAPAGSVLLATAMAPLLFNLALSSLVGGGPGGSGGAPTNATSAA